MDPAQLATFRKAVAAKASGEKIAAIVAALRKKGYGVEGQELKRVPSPHPQEHPRGELLKHKRLFYWRRWKIEPWIATPKARDRVRQAWHEGADLEAWLARHLGADKQTLPTRRASTSSSTGPIRKAVRSPIASDAWASTKGAIPIARPEPRAALAQAPSGVCRQAAMTRLTVAVESSAAPPPVT